MKSKRQQQIIEQAIKIIDKKGIQGLTIKNLSKAIGISEPAIYRHFESKTDIILAIIEILSDTSKLFSQIISNKEGTALDKIKFIINRIISIFKENPSFVSVIFAEEIFRNQTILREKIIWVMNKNEEIIENILQQGQLAGDISTELNIRSLALIIMGSLRLLVKRWQIGNYTSDIEKDSADLIKTIEYLIK